MDILNQREEDGREAPSCIGNYLQKVLSVLKEQYVCVSAKLRFITTGYKTYRKDVRNIINVALDGGPGMIQDACDIFTMAMEDIVRSPKMMSSVATLIRTFKNVSRRPCQNKELGVSTKILELVDKFENSKINRGTYAIADDKSTLSEIDSLISKGELDGEFRAFAEKELARRAALRTLDKDEQTFAAYPTSYTVTTNVLTGKETVRNFYMGATEIRRLHAMLLESEKSDPSSPKSEG
jgi:hypothetical protein